MPTIEVDVNPSVLKWVMQQIGDFKSDDINIDRINKWIDGSKKPTFGQIEKISNYANIPLGYFFLNSPPVEQYPLVEYRTVDSVKNEHLSRNLIETIEYMEYVQEWMKQYRIDNKYDVISFVSSLNIDDDYNHIADIIRKWLKLDVKWYEKCKDSANAFNAIRQAVGDVGIIVMSNGVVGNNTHRTLNVNEFRAFALVDEYAPLIFINATDSKAGKLFSIFHEICHIGFGENDLYNVHESLLDHDAKRIEQVCNKIASELIAPLKYFLESWNARKNKSVFDRIREMGKIFNCSMVVIARKAFDNHLIGIDDYQEIVEISKKTFKKKSGNGGDYYVTMASKLDHNLLRAIHSSLSSGRITYTEAFKLTNTNRKTYKQLCDHMEVRG